MCCFAGIDIGTSSTKMLLMRDDGTVIASAQQGYGILRPKAGYAEQNLEDLWNAVLGVMKALSAQYPDEVRQTTCIGLPGQMHALVMLDRSRHPLRNAVIWADLRSGSAVERILQTVAPSEYAATALNNLSTGFSLSSLIWVRDNEPEIFDRTDKVVMIKDYIRYRMCGELGCEASDASSSGMFDVAGRTWAWSIIDRLGLPRAMFPPCSEAIDVAGAQSPDIAEETGFPQGIPIAFGGGDTLMHEVGTAMIGEDRPWVANIGTSTTFTCAMKQAKHDPDYRTNTFCHCRSDLWILMGATLCGGAGISWLRNNIFRGTTLDELNALASSVAPGSDGLIFLPYLNGARAPDNDPNAKGMLFGMTIGHTREHVMRAVLEGIIFSMKNSFELLKRVTGRTSECVICSGGGARSALLLQMQADMFGCPVRTTVSAEQACIGASITAAVSSGHYVSLEEGCRAAVHFSDVVIHPIRENVDRYAELFEIYRRLYSSNKQLMEMY